MTINPFARKEEAAAKVEPGFVKVMFNYMKSDKNSNARMGGYPGVTNGYTDRGTRFFYRELQGGFLSLPGRVMEAQDVNFILKDGSRTDVSNNLIGQTLNIRLEEDEFEDLIIEAESCEKGIGIEVVFMIPTGTVDIGTLTMQSTTGEQVRSYTVVGELVDDAVEECLGTIVSDKLDIEELNAYFNQSASRNAAAAEEARLANAAARQSMGSAANLADSVKANAEL